MLNSSENIVMKVRAAHVFPAVQCVAHMLNCARSADILALFSAVHHVGQVK